jgi:hypothetical protein
VLEAELKRVAMAADSAILLASPRDCVSKERMGLGNLMNDSEVELEVISEACLVLLARIRSRNVAFQFLNRLRLIGDNPFHKIAKRDHSCQVVILDHREMAKMVPGHDCHAIVYGVVRTHKDDWACHDLTNKRVDSTCWGFSGGLVGRLRGGRLPDTRVRQSVSPE